MSSTGFGFPARPIKRKIFVSYHHGGDQAYYDTFSAIFHDAYDLVSDRSLDRARNSNDHEYIMRYIRENHITGSSTIIVLCGLNTWQRKYVDWEIYSALRQETSLVGIKLPTLPVVNNGCHKPARLQDNIDSGYAVWTNWEAIINNPAQLLQIIESANLNPTSAINNTRARRVNNG